MEIIFDMIMGIIVAISFGINFFALKMIKNIENDLCDLKKYLKIRQEILDTILTSVVTSEIETKNISHQFELFRIDTRSLLALKDLLETTKPMKSNNWDSVREVFKGSTRIANERD